MSDFEKNGALAVTDWEENFENSRSRVMKTARWVSMPNRHDGLRYSRMVKHKDGAELFAAWILIVEVASKCERRGVLAHSDGSPMTADDLAEITRAPVKWFLKAIPYLLGIRWLYQVTDNVVTGACHAGCQAGDRHVIGRVSSGVSGYCQEDYLDDCQSGDGSVYPPRARGREEGKKEGIPPTVPQGGLESVGSAGALPEAFPGAIDPSPEIPPEKKEGGAGRERVVPADVRGRWFLERVCALWGRDPRRTLGYEAQSALPGVLAIERGVLEQELKHVEWFYRLPGDDAVNELRSRRSSVEKLIANWPEEVDRARGFAKKTGAGILAQKKEGRPEPAGWREAARSLSDDPDRCVLPERFEDLPGDVKRDVVRLLAEKKEGA